MAVTVVVPKTGSLKAEATRSPRLAIYTDAASADEVPQTVRFAAEMISTEDLSVFQGKPIDEHLDGAIAWVRGDRLLRGATDDLRRAFFTPAPACTLVPVHLPCLAEADLISVQPRLMAVGARVERVSRTIRISGATSLSPTARAAFEESSEPWAGLHCALLREQRAGGGLEALQELWQTRNLSPMLASLVLRNIVLALMRLGKTEKAHKLLKAGFEVYPDYAELHYLDGILWLSQKRPTNAAASLNRALQSSGRGHIGSGGETSYRTLWLLGTILEEAGDQQRAIKLFLSGVHQRPAFALSVAGVVRQRVSKTCTEQLELVLCELVRREPPYLETVFDFFVRHRSLDAPRRLLRTLPLPEDVRETLQMRLDAAERMFLPARATASERPGVVLRGAFFAHSGHARINREIGRAIMETDAIDSALEQFEYATAPARAFPEGALIQEGLRRHPGHLDLTIRHQWPPDFRRPERGKLACILPWEHNAVPRAWVREIQRSVDELWVPSKFVAAAFVDGGVDRGRVQVIPNGVATDVFHPMVEPWRPQGCRECVFLFVGGTIRRKGIDVLMQAYAEAFSPDDDVTLIVKDLGSRGFYRHNNMLRQIQAIARDPETAHVIALADEMDDGDLAKLYRGCDALVLPYRGEGFAMPLAEAMACGKPVVTTAAGPAIEFCSPETSYFIRAEEVSVPDQAPAVGEFTGLWTWFEPDAVELAETLRHIYTHRDEASKRGKLAAQVSNSLAWPRVVEMYLKRIEHLTGDADAIATHSRHVASVSR